MPQAHTPSNTPPTGRPLRRHGWLLLGLIAVWMATVLAAGLTSEVSLGDEIVHTRFAQNIQSQGGLTCYDELYGSPFGKGLRFQDTPLWAIGLVGLWQLVPGEPLWIAQVYQAFWGALLIGAAYLLGRAVHDSRTGLWAALLTATAPAVVLYSTVLYLDVPYVAVGTLALWAVVTRRYALAGLLLAACFAVKINGFFLLVPFGWVAMQQVLYPHVRWWEGFGSMLTATVALAAALLYGATGLDWPIVILFLLGAAAIFSDWLLVATVTAILCCLTAGTPFVLIPLIVVARSRRPLVRGMAAIGLKWRRLAVNRPSDRPGFPAPPSDDRRSFSMGWKALRLAAVVVMLSIPLGVAFKVHRTIQVGLIRQYVQQHTPEEATAESATGGTSPKEAPTGIIHGRTDPRNVSIYSSRNILARLFNKPLISRERLASSMLNPAHLAAYLGGALALGGLVTFVLRLARRGPPVDGRLLAVVVLLYLLMAVVMFSLNSPIRYILPVFPVLGAIVGRRCALWLRRRWVVTAVVTLCLLQMMGAAVVVGRQRKKSPERMAAYGRIRKHVPQEAYILYPGQELVIYANRRLVWGNTILMNVLFWPESPRKAQAILEYNGIRYVAIPRSRIYSDAGLEPGQRHYNGYPQSLVDAMTEWPFMHRVGWMPPDAPLIVYRVEWTGLPRREFEKLIDAVYADNAADEASISH